MRKVIVLFFFLSVLLPLFAHADRIYIMNSSGYNAAGTELRNAISSNGHTVVLNTSGTLPVGFTSTCVNPTGGYDWLCFFGNNSWSLMLTQIKAYIDAGGKVFYQYEVDCCTNSAASVGLLLSGLTGLAITPSTIPNIGKSPLAPHQPGWEASGLSCCMTLKGNAYKGLNGVPLANQLRATANLNGGIPTINNCLNFGFVFTTTDFLGTADKGAIVGIGDVNIWYDGGEPFFNGGTIPVNMQLINYFFPNASSTCYLFKPGCPVTNPVKLSNVVVDLGKDTTLCSGETLLLNADTSSAVWQNTTASETFLVTQPGTYWAQIKENLCMKADTVEVEYASLPEINLGKDTALCNNETLILDAHTSNALWQNNATAETFPVTQSGTYWAQVKQDRCIEADTVQVTFVSLPEISLGKDTTLCPNETLILDAKTSNAVWQNNATAETFHVTQPGTYRAQVKQDHCIKADTVLVDYFLPPEIDLKKDTILCTGETLVLNVLHGNVFQWQDGSSNPAYTVSLPGNYWVNYDCGTTDTVRVYFRTCCNELIIPNLITPNGDGQNDFFYIGCSDRISWRFEVFNRWSEPVYLNENYKNQWNGEGLSDGVYYFILTKEDGKIYKGWVQLLR